MNKPLTFEQASSIYHILMDHAGADGRDYGHFVAVQTDEFVSEWRFMGDLGFGGKFWRNTTRLSDGSWGEAWYVNNYREDETPETLAIIARTNEALETLRIVKQ